MTDMPYFDPDYNYERVVLDGVEGPRWVQGECKHLDLRKVYDEATGLPNAGVQCFTCDRVFTVKRST